MRLARLALAGTAFEGLSALFTGPTGIGFSVDPVAAAKVIVAYAKANEKLTIVGGATGGQVLDPDSLLALQVNGAALSLDHGHPARVIVPALPGVHCTKWVRSITFRAA